MQTKLSSFVAMQFFGFSCQIELKVKLLILLKEIYSGFWLNQAEYGCAEVFLRGPEPTHFG